MNLLLFEGLIAVFVLGGLVLSVEVGLWLGARARDPGDRQVSPQLGAIQGAILGLLGLLLAFSFGGAAGRFIDRLDTVVAEANAIGTAYLRADLLSEPERTRLRRVLQRYTEARLAYADEATLQRTLTPQQKATVAAMQNEIWEVAVAGVETRPEAILAVLNPVNEVIDLHTTRLAIGGRRLPPIVLAVLLVASFLALMVLGYGCGISGERRTPLTTALALLIASILWITIDLDQPRAGMFQTSNAPLEALEFDAE